MDKIQKGKLGEDAAVQYLKDNGYKIIARNYRASHAEIDIIAQQNEILIFIEVKTRSYDYFGQPEEFVTKKKQDYTAFAASVFMEKNQYDHEFRFDIIAVIMPLEEVKLLKHIKDAYFPGLA